MLRCIFLKKRDIKHEFCCAILKERDFGVFGSRQAGSFEHSGLVLGRDVGCFRMLLPPAALSCMILPLFRGRSSL